MQSTLDGVRVGKIEVLDSKSESSIEIVAWVQAKKMRFVETVERRSPNSFLFVVSPSFLYVEHKYFLFIESRIFSSSHDRETVHPPKKL